jgi:chromosomal replication initiation ATPase DnaA
MVTIISGKEGMGKTAHLHYLLQRVRKSVNHTAFIDAQKFVSRYAFAASNGTLSAFRKNTIFAQGGKAVITYRGDHVNLDFLGPRFASRLTSGLVIRLQDASEEEKSEFLQYYLLASDKTTDVESELISKAKNFKQVIEVANAIETCQDNDVSIICRLGSFEDSKVYDLPLIA